MSSIQTGIELNDQFTEVIYGIINAVNMAVCTMEDMQGVMNNDIDASAFEGIHDEITEATIAMNELNAALQNQQLINTDLPIQQPTVAPVEVPYVPEQSRAPPYEWNTDGLEVFTGTGMERFQQEVASANIMLEQLSSTQDSIAQQAYNTNLFPPEAFQNLNSLAVRIDIVRDRIRQIESNPLNMGTDIANAELEMLRGQLSQAVQEQNNLNTAMQNMDVSAANDAYLRLSQTVSNTERYIRDNVDEQGRFNQEISQGVSQADDLMNTIKGMVGAYVSIQAVGDVFELSDSITQTNARLDLIVDDGGSVEELQNKIYASAQNARGLYLATADAVSKLGMQAGDAFSSNDELIAFTELLNKQFVNAGTSAQGIDSVMLQLTQSMAAGKMQGEELNAVLDNAAPIVQDIQRYLEEVQGIDASNIKELASEGMLTAEVIKSAMFYAADEINAKFDSVPMTWGQIWNSMQNSVLVAFQPVLQNINDLASSNEVQSFANGAIEAMATLANVVLWIFELVATVGGFIADNWSIISPIVYGVVGALAVYGAYLAITKGLELASAAASALHAAFMSTKIGITAALTGSTMAATAAQMGYNGALYACPIVWIIMRIIALIAVIFAVCSAIAKATGIANSGFSVITGGVNVVIAFFKNLGLSVANIALGIGNAFAALGSNMMTALNNAICSIQSWFYDLLSTGLTVIEGICEALNKLPFVEIDYSGISSAADDYAAKSAEAAGNMKDYQSISDAFNEGFTTFDTFRDGWVSDAFNAGAAWGDGIADAVGNFSISDLFGSTDIPSPEDYTFDEMAGSLEGIANDTGNISDAMDITEEDLRYLRDIAEQESVNRYTTAEIHVDMSGMQNTVNSGQDLDGFISEMTDAVNEAIDNMAEGVHE